MAKAFVIVIFLGLLTACGQKGPLFLPEENNEPRLDQPSTEPASGEKPETEKPRG